MKKVLILMGSPRPAGNTASLVKVFEEAAAELGAESETLNLYDMNLRGCLACRACQKDWTIFGCPQQDDMQGIFDRIMAADLIVLASPIYSWYCTTPMKAVLDRMVYGMNKFYGEEKGPALWAGKELAIITTCGYPPEKGADLWEQGVKRYCKHSSLTYRGMLCERHMGYNREFMDEDKIACTKKFAEELI